MSTGSGCPAMLGYGEVGWSRPLVVSRVPTRGSGPLGDGSLGPGTLTGLGLQALGCGPDPASPDREDVLQGGQAWWAREGPCHPCTDWDPVTLLVAGKPAGPGHGPRGRSLVTCSPMVTGGEAFERVDRLWGETSPGVAIGQPHRALSAQAPHPCPCTEPGGWQRDLHREKDGPQSRGLGP